MEQGECYLRLEQLLKVTSEYENDSSMIEKLSREVNNAELYTPSNLRSFDDMHQESFILSIVGEKPKKSSKWIPWNNTKRKKDEYADAQMQYKKKREAALQEYKKRYLIERSELREKDTSEKTKIISMAKSAYDAAEEKYQISKTNWEHDTILSPRLRKSNIIQKLMNYLEDGRADSLKEAVNKYYDYEHFEKEAKLAAEHRKYIEDVLNKQNETINRLEGKVDDISFNVDRAVEMAQDAKNRADDAYQKADEVMSNKISY